MLKYFFSLFCCLVICYFTCYFATGESNAYAEQDNLELIILHTNDTHSWVAGFTEDNGNKQVALDDSKSTGGYARIASYINKAKAEQDNVLAFDAGDQFQGTLFYAVNRMPLVADLNKLIPWDAQTLGNHEFDEGCQELVKFLELINIPTLAANLKPNSSCPLANSRYQPYLIKKIRGTEVAIIGLSNNEVQKNSNACVNTNFSDTFLTLKEQIATLKERGIKHIICLSHLGLDIDKQIAGQIDGLDLIVGGHSHSYLGTSAKEKSIAGPYPIVIQSPNGEPVLIVTAKSATEYIGELKITFNASGKIIAYTGQARKLSPDYPSDAKVQALTKEYAAKLVAYTQEKIAENPLDFADGLDLCRQGECLSGLLLTDAMLEFAREYGAEIALVNSGSIRNSLDKGQISRGNLLSILPFNNKDIIYDFTTKEILMALEHGVKGTKARGPSLLQVAGLIYTVNTNKPIGQRVVEVKVQDRQGQWLPLTTKNTWRVVISDFLAKGGSNFNMLKVTYGHEKAISSHNELELLTNYLKKNSPVKMPTTGRIKFLP